MKDLSTEDQLSILMRGLNSLPRGILITDCSQDDDPIIYVNDYFLTMSGYTREETIGRNCRFMQGEKTDPDSQKKIAIALSNKESCSVKMINYRKNGDTFLNEFTICPITDENNKVTHFIALEREL
jgi:PAS domain S-box-containing protein